MKNIVIYTAIFGKYNKLIEQPNYKNVDFICYTNQNLTSKSWKVIKVKPPVENDDTRSNRYYKILPHKHLQDYDISIYIDGNILIYKDIKQLVAEKMNTATMACFDHAQNIKDSRNCIYKEYEAILEIGKNTGSYRDIPEVMQKQMDRFKAEGYPENNELITAPILIRKHKEQEVIKVMESWWNIVKTESKRDQLSFNYVAWKLNYTNFTTINGDVRKGNKWFHTFSHSSNKFKIFLFKLSKLAF